MKKRVFMVGLSCAALILLSVFWSWVRQMSAAPTPEPSLPGGYYDDAFVLELKAPSNGSIYYTTDGSEPSTSSMLYTDGIRIQNRSQEPNVYTAVRNVVADWKTFAPDQKPVPKGTVIRAIFVNSWGMQSEVLTQTYFVGVSAPQKGYTLCLVFEYDDLFGENGIHVTGKEYDDWYLAGEKTSPAPIPNFEKKQEVAAIVEMMDASGDVMNQPAGLRLQGATARGEVKKRFTLTAREEYGGSKVFDTVLYDGITTHSVMLKYYLPDAMIADLVSDRSVSVQRSIPVRVFLNGEYWYDSYMLERYDAQYFRQHYQADNYVLIKNGDVDENTYSDAESTHYREFMYWVDSTDFSDNEQWEQFQKEADVQSYIDYIVTNYYFCNIDFDDYHNYVLWRSPLPGDTEYEDTRWRWCIYDIDALEWVANDPQNGDPVEINVFFNDRGFGIRDTTLFHSLSRNSVFCQRFVLSFMDMLNNNFTPEKVGRVLETYGYTLDWKDGYFRKRPDYAVEHLAKEFGLTGSLETVEIRSANPEMGDVIVNTSQIDLSTGSWSGRYFTDYPITITATAREGYEFQGWKGDADTAGNTLTVSVDGGVTLEAVFAKEK